MVLALLLLGSAFGACIGSFCNVLIIRLHEGASIGGRSHCMHCQKTLASWQLIPVVSWIALRARCAFCRAPIHWQYPVVETMGALIGAAAVWTSLEGTGVNIAALAFTSVFLFSLLVIAAFDIRWQLVPVEFTLGAAAALGIARIALLGVMQAPMIIVGTALTAGGLWLIVWLSRGRLMGEGDPIVGILIGAVLGWPLAPIALAVAFMFGGVVAAALLAAGRVTRETAVPFVPFLAIGAFVAYFWGSQIVALFLNVSA